MPTRISIPDGGSIAISTRCLLSGTLWDIQARTITGRFEVRGLTKVVISTKPGGFLTGHRSRSDFTRDDAVCHAVQSVVLETDLGTMTVAVNPHARQLQLSLAPEGKMDELSSFTNWRRNLESGDRSEQSIEYPDPNVLINRVIVNEAFFFERNTGSCQVDIYFDTPSEQIFENCGGGASAP